MECGAIASFWMDRIFGGHPYGKGGGDGQKGQGKGKGKDRGDGTDVIYTGMDRIFGGHSYGNCGGDGQKGKGKGKGKDRGDGTYLIYTGEGWTLEQRLALLDGIFMQIFQLLADQILQLLRVYKEIMEQIRDRYNLPDPRDPDFAH